MPKNDGIQVTAVMFSPTKYGETATLCASWKEASELAREMIVRAAYKGHVIRRDEPGFHPRRYFQEDDTLVVYSRAFVQMRVVEPVQDRPGSAVRSGLDGVACSWEVFHDGTAEWSSGRPDGV